MKLSPREGERQGQECWYEGAQGQRDEVGRVKATVVLIKPIQLSQIYHLFLKQILLYLKVT